MKTPSEVPLSADWSSFQSLNARRRAVRDFDGGPVDDADIRAVLAEALLAPSSGNLQAYELHWVREPALRARLAAACEGQRAATTAAALVVVVARVDAAKRAAALQARYVEETAALDERSKAYHRKELSKFGKFLRLAPSALLGPVKALLSALSPVLTLVPLGPSGMRHWAARSSLFAAQTLLLAASARGLDSCPMEGFDPRQVARLLGLPRGAVVPLVIALGRRRADARLEARWRRPFAEAVVEH